MINRKYFPYLLLLLLIPITIFVMQQETTFEELCTQKLNNNNAEIIEFLKEADKTITDLEQRLEELEISCVDESYL